MKDKIAQEKLAIVSCEEFAQKLLHNVLQKIITIKV